MKILCVTDRKLCPDDFFTRLQRIVKLHPHRVILREKDLSDREYRELTLRCREICEREGVPLVVHSHLSIAKELGEKRVHLPFPALLRNQGLVKGMKEVGVSVHSVEEAQTAQRLGADSLIVGHIYPTDCKKGLPARGIAFLKEIVEGVTIPVFAIGGITPQRLKEINSSGASGVCIMSPLMTCEDPEECLREYRTSILSTEFLRII